MDIKFPFQKLRFRLSRPKQTMFVGPTEISGIYAQLVEGLNQIGFQAELVERNPHPHNYHSSYRSKSWMINACRKLNRAVQIRKSANNAPLLTWVLTAMAILIWLTWTPFAMARYSTFLFVFGNSLWPWNLDLPLLRLLGKKTVMHLGHGSESRPPYLGGNLDLDAQTLLGARKLASSSKAVRRTVRMAEKHANIVVGSPLNTHYFSSSPFVNFLYIGFPQLQTANPPSPGSSKGYQTRVKVLHAPSKPELKGTNIISEIVKQLQNEGLHISYTQLTGVSNDQILAAISDADLVVDQLYSDTPMTGVAMEASAMGKACIMGGYGFKILEPFTPQEFKDIVITCHPDEIKETIRSTVLSGCFRDRGERAKTFALEYLAPIDVARRLALVLEGRTPSNWWVDPHSMMYLMGVAQSESESIRQVQGMVEILGPSSLQLDHKPRLREALVSWTR
jgi:hypothetical protein